jgi:hypothetical protein
MTEQTATTATADAFHADGQWVVACRPDDPPCTRGVRCDYCHS